VRRPCRQCGQPISLDASMFRVERTAEHTDWDFCSRSCAVAYLAAQQVAP